MGRRAYYTSVPPALTDDAEDSFEAWRDIVDGYDGPTYTLGKSYGAMARMLGNGWSGDLDVLGRAVLGAHPLHVPSPATLAALGPGPHPDEERLSDTYVVPPDDVAAAAARMNVLAFPDLLANYDPGADEPSWGDPKGTRAYHWDYFEGLRTFYTEAAIRCDAVVVYFG